MAGQLNRERLVRALAVAIECGMDSVYGGERWRTSEIKELRSEP